MYNSTINNNNNNVVLITGSSSGIGAATAILFAKRGFQVAVTGNNEEKVNKVAQECSRASPNKLKALAIVADLSNPNNGELIVKKTIDHFKTLDVLVNNTSIHFKTNSADKSSFELYRKTMAINCESVIKTTMEALPHLEKSQGNIVFVSSVASIRPGFNDYAYRMSKAAVSSYAKCLAIDIAPKIRVNIVSPGHVSTETFFDRDDTLYINQETKNKQVQQATLLGRIGECDEIARTIFYLASDEASFVNGAELFVDGGHMPTN